MNAVPWIKVIVAVVGITVWAFGYQRDDSTLRWIGIAFLAVAMLLRFYRPRPRNGGSPPPV